MFYDANAPIQLGSNYVAQSAHFVVNGSTLSQNDYPSSKSGKGGLSAGAAAGIAIAVTLLAEAICGLAVFFCWYRPRQQRRLPKALGAGPASSVLQAEEQSKPEMTGEGVRTTMSTVPAPAPALVRPELTAFTTHAHEVDSENNPAHLVQEMPSTGPGGSWTTMLPPELPPGAPSLASVGSQHQQNGSRTFPPIMIPRAVKRKEVPSAAAMGDS